jgi:hypothetical protein
MEAQDYPIRYFESLLSFATALKAVPAQVLEVRYDYGSFGSWVIVLRCKGITLRAIFDGKEFEASLQRSSQRKHPHEWQEPLWRKRHASSEIDAELQSEIIRTLHGL